MLREEARLWTRAFARPLTRVYAPECVPFLMVVARARALNLASAPTACDGLAAISLLGYLGGAGSVFVRRVTVFIGTLVQQKNTWR